MARAAGLAAALALAALALLCRVPAARALVREVSGPVGAGSHDLLSNADLTGYRSWANEEQRFFGWNPGGRLSIDLEVRADGGGNASLPVFVLVSPYDEASDLENEAARGCAGTALRRFEVYDSLRVEVEAEQVDRFSVFLLNCYAVEGRSVSGTVRFVTSEGGHLGVEERSLPAVYGTVSVMYAALFLVWAALCALHRREVSPVQLAVAVAFLLRMAYYAVESDFQSRRDDGGRVSESMSDGRRAAEDLSDMWGLFTLLTLASGWRTIRLGVTPRETKVCAALFGFYGLLSVGSLACAGESFCRAMQVLKIVVMSFVLIAIIVLMNVAVVALRAELPETRWAAGAGLLYLKYRVYVSFRVLFVAYLLLPTVALATRISLLNWRDEWAYVLVYRVAGLLLEAGMTLPFRPCKGNPMFAVGA